MKNLTQMITLGFLMSCGISTPVNEDPPPSVKSTTDLINELFSQAVLLSDNEAFVLKIEAIEKLIENDLVERAKYCLLYTSPSPRDLSTSRMPSSA